MEKLIDVDEKDYSRKIRWVLRGMNRFKVTTNRRSMSVTTFLTSKRVFSMV